MTERKPIRTILVATDFSDTAQAGIDWAVERVRSRGIDVTTDLRLGVPSLAILEAAEDRVVDLVVIGTGGRTSEPAWRREAREEGPALS